MTSKLRNDPKGRVRFQGRMEYPHRISLFIFKDFNLDDNRFQANHKRECPYSLCCHPDCLYVGTQKENIQDSIALGHNKELKKTNCSNCGENYKISPTTGHRYCQRCKNNRRKNWRQDR